MESRQLAARRLSEQNAVAGKKICSARSLSSLHASCCTPRATMAASAASAPATSAAPAATFKLLLLGDSGTGKTTFLQRHFSGAFEERHLTPSTNLSAKVYPLVFHTNYGRIVFNVCDTAGDATKSGRVREEGYDIPIHGAECSIIFFDTTSRISYKNVSNWYRGLQHARVDSKIPTVLCANKIDINDRKVKSDAARFHREHHLPYCEISTNYNHEIHVPFLSLARILVGDDELGFVPEPAFAPPVIEVQMSSELRARYQRELGDAAAVPLPEE